MRGLSESQRRYDSMTPDLSYPCATCAGESARSAANNLVEELAELGAYMTDDIKLSLCDQAEEHASTKAKRDDNEPCAKHRPTKDDEE